MWEWNIPWRRDWFEWDRPQIEMFLNDIDRITIDKVRNYSWTWNDGDDKVYTVKSVYKNLQGVCVADQQHFLVCLWRVNVILFTKFFVRQVFSN